MEKVEIIKLLEQFKKGVIDQEEVIKKLTSGYVDDLGFAMIDTSRYRRTGVPEVIYAAEKTVEQVTEIAERMMQRDIPILATRATPEMFESVKTRIPGAVYHPAARTIVYQPVEIPLVLHNHTIHTSSYLLHIFHYLIQSCLSFLSTKNPT